MLREVGIDTKSVQRADNAVTIVLEDPTRQADAVRALQRLATPVRAMTFGAGTSDLTVAAISPEEIRLSLTEGGVRDRVDAAVEQSLEIIRQRVDEVGVAEPTIQRVGAERILVQLPGVQDPARIRELLGSTAQLSFHMLAPVDPSGHVPPGVKVGGFTFQVRHRE
jgi:SecD/SecF fusion protein